MGSTSTYDDLDPLISATYDSGETVTYTYDAAGNITDIATKSPSMQPGTGSAGDGGSVGNASGGSGGGSGGSTVGSVSGGSGGGSGGSRGGGIVAKLSVASADPAAGATGVAVDKIITITFGDDVKQGDGFDKIVLKDGTGKQVACTVSMQGNKLTVTPKEKLAVSTTYTLFIPVGAVQDANNNLMPQDYILTFTTAGSLPMPPKVGFKDMTGHWASDTITKLAGMGIFSGYPDGTFLPDNTVTRAEIASIIARALKLTPGEESALPFSDKNEIPAWARGAVAAAAEEGLLKGYPDQDGVVFRANNPLTRVELAAILSRVIENKKVPVSSQVPTFSDAAAIPAWVKNAVNSVASAGIVSGYPDGSFKPAGNVTRAEAASMVLRLLEKLDMLVPPQET